MGGNQSGSQAALEAAIAALSQIWRLRALSSLYLTKAQDYADQPDFLNLVGAWELPPTLTPEQCLGSLLKLEAELGRRREGAIPKGPRLIDIDLLLFGKVQVHRGDLTIPHPRMKQRRFVIEPLLEIAPDLCEPGSALPYRSCLDSISDQAIYSRTLLKYTNPSV